MGLDYPKTKNDWWNNINKAWSELMILMEMWLPMDSCQFEAVESVAGPKLRDHIVNLKMKKDSELARYLEQAWISAPEDYEYLHRFSGWPVLCDLLSEESVLYEELVA